MLENEKPDIPENSASEENETQLGAEVLAAKLRNYGKENFPELNFNPINHIDVIREGAALHTLNLPKVYAEQLITMETAKYFLYSDSPIIFKLEEALPSLKKHKHLMSENYPDIKKFYEKWSIEKNPKEAEFFALSTLNLFERNSTKENFLKYLFPACVHIYDKKYNSVARAVELLAQAEKSCQSSGISEELKMEFSYLICLYKGFAYFSIEDFEQASLHFNEAASIKNNGNTALFYTCVTSMYIPGAENPAAFLSTIVNYDIKRFMFAIEMNNLNLLIFFLKFAFTYHIFKTPAFAPLLPDIRILLETASDNSKAGYQKLFVSVNNFPSLPQREDITEKLYQEVKFLTSFLDQYRSSRNQFISLLHDTIALKFSMVLQQVKQNIRSNIFNKKMVELDAYDHQMRDENKRIGKLGEEHELNKEILKKKHQEIIDENESKYNETLSNIENKIASIETSPEYDPAKTFNNMLVYNFIISIAVFIIGGFISAFSSSSTSDLGLFGSLIIYGFKWGGFVFLGGLIIASFSSASKLVERSNERHRLQKKLTTFKNQKDRTLERLSKDLEKKVLALDDVYKIRLTEYQKRLKTLRDEKAKHEVELKNAAQKETDEQLTLVDKILNEGVPAL